MANWTPLREALADVATEATFDWGDLDELVGGLPASAYQHAAFWKGARSGWPGFKTSAVQVGESVTFVRIAQSPSAAPFPSHPPAESLGAPDILLIGCVKQKLGVPAPARDLYTSPLFRKGRRYAEATGAPWFVLSAEHGLVAPDEVLAPYDRRLSKSDLEYRLAWGVRVVEQLVAAAGPLSGKSIEVHAGAAYVEPLRQRLVAAGSTITEPLAGLKLGPRLAWYGRGTEPHNTPEPSAPSGPTPEVSELVARLTDESIALSPQRSWPPVATASACRGSTRGGSTQAAPLTWAEAWAPPSIRDSSMRGWPAQRDRAAAGSRRTPSGAGSRPCTSVVATSSRRFG